MSRAPIGKRLRFAVFKRDAFACQYCGAHPPEAVLEVDHIVPVSDEGTSDIDNLVTACFSCNRGKADISLSVIPKSLAQYAEEVRDHEEQLAGYREVMQARAHRIEADAWDVADALLSQVRDKGIRRDNFQSIKMFNERLPLHEVLDAAAIARARFPYGGEQGTFRYFCGICWRKIRQQDEVLQ